MKSLVESVVYVLPVLLTFRTVFDNQCCGKGGVEEGLTPLLWFLRCT